MQEKQKEPIKLSDIISHAISSIFLPMIVYYFYPIAGIILSILIIIALLFEIFEYLKSKKLESLPVYIILSLAILYFFYRYQLVDKSCLSVLSILFIILIFSIIFLNTNKNFEKNSKNNSDDFTGCIILLLPAVTYLYSNYYWSKILIIFSLVSFFIYFIVLVLIDLFRPKHNKDLSFDSDMDSHVITKKTSSKSNKIINYNKDLDF